MKCDGILFSNSICTLVNCNITKNCQIRPYFGSQFLPIVYLKSQNNNQEIYNQKITNHNVAFLDSKKLVNVIFNDLNLHQKVNFKLLHKSSNIEQCKYLCMQDQQLDKINVCHAILLTYDTNNEITQNKNQTLCYAVECKINETLHLYNSNTKNSESTKSTKNTKSCGKISSNNPNIQNILIPTQNFQAGKVKCILNLLVSNIVQNCSVKSIFYNSRLINGLEAGGFVNLGQLNDENECLESVCNLQSLSNLVYYINKLCFAVNCINNFSCTHEKYNPNNVFLNSTIIELENSKYSFSQLSGISFNL